jgi:beta-glucanase (GH16 family)
VVSHVPNEPMYLNIALAVGGTFPGPPGPETWLPARLEIDWVEVYSSAALARGCLSGWARRPVPGSRSTSPLDRSREEE